MPIPGGICPGGGVVGFLPAPLERAGTWPSRAGPHFSGEMGERAPGAVPLDPVGERVSFPHPFSLDCCRSGDFLLSAYLACGLKDQRLMARPPAWAGGRSGSLTAGKSGNPNGYSLPSPKGYLSTPPARPAGGRAKHEPFAVRAAGRASRKKYSLPTHPPPEKGSREEPPPPGVLSPISSQEMGPRLGKPRFPAVPTAQGQNPTTPPTPSKNRAPHPPGRRRGYLVTE